MIQTKIGAKHLKQVHLFLCTLQFFIFVYNIFSFEMGCYLNHCVTENINMVLPTNLKHRIDVLHDKMGMDIASKRTRSEVYFL